MSTLLNNRLAKEVAAYDVEEHSVNVSNGQTVYISEATGSSVYSNDVKVEVVLGNEVIFVTHGDKTENVDQHYTATEDTTLKIRLVNDSANSETLSCQYKGDLE